MNKQSLLKLAERLRVLFKTPECWSVRGSGKATTDCDIAIDTVYESRLPGEMLPSSIIQYWIEPVPYSESLTRHKFIVGTI